MFLKNIFSFFIITILAYSTLNAKSFSKEATTQAVFTQSGKHKHWCPICGMDIKTFYKTSHTSKLHNHKDRQYCSIRCLAVDMQEYKIDLESIKVVDASTQKFILAKDAFYVVGSKVKGTMTKVSKLAFAQKESAENFIKKYKGKIVDFDIALSMAKESLKSDIAMVMKKKEKKIYPMGKNIFQKMCKENIDLNNYIEINQLKADIKSRLLCKPLNKNQFQALALYLWEVKRFGDLDNISGTIKVTKDEKCPICGMFVYKYPRWAGQIFYDEKHYSFDGVKDLMKYYFLNEHKKGISKILVTDYYSQKAIDATKSYYVIGSDIYGPMGDELIPFINKDDAKTFYMDHKGKKILLFNDITEKEVYKLDE
ncbi:MAG: nitrous oxide reductase accessory protein NosL [Campylobacterota bacterium]|nr:nitrous oxide reductase accessory protein NosL [Campylobacterota bacterium]